MTEKMISAGICGKWFYRIDRLIGHDTFGKPEYYYSLWTNDGGFPDNFSKESLEVYLEEHRDEGGSLAGTWEEIMEELNDLFQCGNGNGKTDEEILAEWRTNKND